MRLWKINGSGRNVKGCFGRLGRMAAFPISMERGLLAKDKDLAIQMAKTHLE